MPLSNPAETLPVRTVELDGGMVQFQRSPADTLTFDPGAPHVRAHPLDY